MCTTINQQTIIHTVIVSAIGIKNIKFFSVERTIEIQSPNRLRKSDIFWMKN